MLQWLASYYEWRGGPDKAEGRLAVCAKAITALAEDAPPEEEAQTFFSLRVQFCSSIPLQGATVTQFP